MKWHIDGSSPLYLQLADDIRYSIICGELPAGARIPSVRELAADSRVNPNTMQRALIELEREGLVITHGTSGKFVTDDSDVLLHARQTALEALVTDFTSRASALGFGVTEAVEHVLRRSERKVEE